eukprot:866232-Pleurochrysis_carterae.AAC.1
MNHIANNGYTCFDGMLVTTDAADANRHMPHQHLQADKARGPWPMRSQKGDQYTGASLVTYV